MMSSRAAENVQLLAVATSLNALLKGTHFNICVIEKCAAVLGVYIKEKVSYKTLATLHCVDYAQMPEALRDQLPELITDCLGVVILERLIGG